MSEQRLLLPDEPRGDVLLQTERFEVREVEIAPGKSRAFAIHPGSICVLPVLDDGRMVVIRNHRPTAGRPLLEFVAGTLEPPEPPLECARRELSEEAGYEADRIEALGGFFIAPGLTNEYMHLFVARGLSPVGQRLEAGENITVELLTMDALVEAARTGAIEDAKTLASLFRYRLLLACNAPSL